MSRKRCTRLLLGRSYPECGKGLNGIKLILQGVSCKILASCSACSGSSLTPSIKVYSIVALRRSGSFCKYPLTEANNSLMGYFLLIGTSSLRNASFGACNDTANETSITSPSLSSIGTTPEVLSVTRRLDKP